MDEALSILLVEDDDGDAELVRRELAKAGGGAPERVRTLAEARARLERGGVDVVLTDLNLPGSLGLDTLRSLKAWTREVPVVVLTGSFLEDGLGRQAVREGAQDYLYKDGLRGPWLARALAFAVERRRLESFKEDVLRDVSHELQTPVAAAYAFLSAILDGQAGPLDAGLRRYVEVAFRNMHYLSRLVDDLVEAARAREGRLAVEPRRADLCRAAAEAAEDMRPAFEAAGLKLETRCPGDLPPALADPKRCRQVLLNLLSNALKFTPKGGRAAVSVSLEPGPPAMLRVAVSDTGVGVAPEALPRLFGGVRAAKHPPQGRRGLGFGLAICRELVALQGGRLGAESAPGAGSTFWFTAPAFSLEDLMAALPDGPLALLELRVPPSETAPAAAREGARAAVDELGRLLPPRSVVLPEMSEDAEERRVHLLVPAAAAPDGARLAEALSLLPALRAEGLAPSVRALGGPIPFGPGGRAAAAREVGARVAAALAEAA